MPSIAPWSPPPRYRVLPGPRRWSWSRRAGIDDFPPPRLGGGGGEHQGRAGWGASSVRGPDRPTVGLERRLRHQQTDAERKFWFALRDRRLDGFKFVRQEAIA